MEKRSLKSRAARLICVLAMGGSVMQLAGCDPNVRSTLIVGLEATTNSLVDALISAFFISIDDQAGTDGGLATT